jgi:hypothetical protein
MCGKTLIPRRIMGHGTCKFVPFHERDIDKIMKLQSRPWIKTIHWQEHWRSLELSLSRLSSMGGTTPLIKWPCKARGGHRMTLVPSRRQCGALLPQRYPSFAWKLAIKLSGKINLNVIHINCGVNTFHTSGDKRNEEHWLGMALAPYGQTKWFAQRNDLDDALEDMSCEERSYPVQTGAKFQKYHSLSEHYELSLI